MYMIFSLIGSVQKRVCNSETNLSTAFLLLMTALKGTHTGEYNRPHLKRRVDLARALAKHGGCDCGGSIALVSIELDDDTTMQRRSVLVLVLFAVTSEYTQ